MGNRRVIVVLLVGIAACLLLLWYAERRDVSSAKAARRATALTAGRSLATLDQLTIERSGLYLEVRRQRHGWEMYSPFVAAVDQGAVAQLLDAIETARVSDAIRFSEMKRRNLSLGDFGLAPPAARVTFQGAGWTRTLLVGAPTPTGQEVFARDVSTEEIWSVPAEVAARLPRAVDDWRARDLLAGDRSRLRLLEIKAQGRPFIRLSKETGTWRLLQPADAPADDRKVEALLDTLYDGKAVRFVWPSVASVTDTLATDSALKSRMEVYGLASDVALQVTVQESANAEPAKVVFGNRCDGEDNLRYVLMPGGNAVAAVSNALFEALHYTPADLRDMRLFFEKPQHVRRLEIATDGQLFVLTQNDAQWQMESPVAMRLDPSRITAALGQFLHLTAESVSERSDTAQAPDDGADAPPPVSQVEMLTDSGAFRMVFLHDELDEDFYQVTMTNNPVAYHLAASNVPPAFLNGEDALALCDRTVLALTNGAIRRVTVKRPDGTSEILQRESSADSGWRSAGDAREIDVAAVKPFIETVSQLTVERIEAPLAAPPGTDPHELKSPWLEITLDVDADDAIRKTIIIGSETPDGGRYMAVRGQDIVFVLSAETLAALEKTLTRE